jgi:hypothetical protein
MRKRQGAQTSEKISQSMRSVDRLLRDAIRSKRLIEFVYQDLRRVAEPHDYGIQNGVQKLLVYQVRGESRSGRLPDWRLVVISSMERVRILDEMFPGSRVKTVDEHKKWDQIFARVTPMRKHSKD